MATKVTSKVATSTKAAPADKAKAAIKVVAVPAALSLAIQKSASDEVAKTIAISTAEQSIVKVGKLTGETMAKHGYEVTRASIKPLWEAAYKAANAKAPATKQKDEKALVLYAGQQLSRVMSIAFPGGKDADPKARQVAASNRDRGLNENKPVQVVYGLSTGRLAFDKKGEIVEVRQQTRGASNKLTPFAAFSKTLKDSMSAYKQAKGSIEQMLTAFSDIAVELELIEDGNDLKKLLE